MKVEATGSCNVRVELTRRNLLALLAKLDGHPADSARTIEKTSADGWTTVAVTAVPDAAHYSAREAGPLHPSTQRAVELLAAVRQEYPEAFEPDPPRRRLRPRRRRGLGRPW